MNTFSSQMSLPVNLSRGGAAGRKATPGDVGDGLFQNFLQKVNAQDEDGVLALIPWAGFLKDPDIGLQQLVSGETGSEAKGLGLFRMGGQRILLPESDVPQLARFLERHGFSAQEIDRLILSLSEKNGDIRMDRLLAKLHALFQEKAETANALVVDRQDVPKIQEVLFKMGLGADDVQETIGKTANADGNLPVRRLISALHKYFSGLDPEMERRLANVLRQETGVRFQPGDLQQMAREADLEAAINRVTANTSDHAREAARREIAALMQEKGIPPQDVKRFLESLEVRQASNWTQGGQNGGNPLRDDPSVQVVLRKDGVDWEKGGWKERILDILNRQEILAGRGGGTEAGAGKASPFGNLAEMLEEALSGRRAAKRPEEKTWQVPLPGSEGKTAAKSTEDRPTQAAKATMGAVSERGRSAAEPRQPARSFSGAEMGASRAERTDAPQQAAPVRPAPAAAPLPEPLPKIVDRMVWMVRAGEQASRIQITPPELGRLDLEIVIRQGHLHANLNAENPMVKELIEANLQQLRQQLSNLGFVVERFEVAAGLDERRFSEQQALFQGRKGGRGQKPNAGGIAQGEGTEPIGKSRRAPDGLYQIDVHV